ncbi:hypothetical protein ISS22_13845 [candidate division KSB1 bacterium]|nr:hypothetical protein [candidate division KSB1 bacterium]
MNAKLTKQNIEYEVDLIINEAKKQNQKIITQLFENRELKDIRLLANLLIQQSDLWVLFAAKTENAHLIFAHPESADYNLNELLNQVVHLIDGRGGGRPNFVEAGGKNISGIQQALECARVIVENSI